MQYLDNITGLAKRIAESFGGASEGASKPSTHLAVVPRRSDTAAKTAMTRAGGFKPSLSNKVIFGAQKLSYRVQLLAGSLMEALPSAKNVLPKLKGALSNLVPSGGYEPEFEKPEAKKPEKISAHEKEKLALQKEELALQKEKLALKEKALKLQKKALKAQKPELALKEKKFALKEDVLSFKKQKLASTEAIIKKGGIAAAVVGVGAALYLGAKWLEGGKSNTSSAHAADGGDQVMGAHTEKLATNSASQTQSSQIGA
jgi:hypothetical protein